MAWPVAVEQVVQPRGEYKPEDTDPEAMLGTLSHGCSALLKDLALLRRRSLVLSLGPNSGAALWQ